MSRVFCFVLQDPSGGMIPLAALAEAIGAQYVYAVFRWTLTTCIVSFKREQEEKALWDLLVRHNFRVYRSADNMLSFMMVTKQDFDPLTAAALLQINGSSKEYGVRPRDYHVSHLINIYLTFQVKQAQERNNALQAQNDKLALTTEELKVKLFLAAASVAITLSSLTAAVQIENEKMEKTATRSEATLKALDASRAANVSLRRQRDDLHIKRCGASAQVEKVREELREEKIENIRTKLLLQEANAAREKAEASASEAQERCSTAEGLLAATQAACKAGLCESGQASRPKASRKLKRSFAMARALPEEAPPEIFSPSQHRTKARRVSSPVSTDMT